MAEEVSEQEQLAEAAADQSVDNAAGLAPLIEPSPIFQCSVCRRHLPADQVYDSDGLIVCMECWERSHPAVASVQSGTTSPAPSLSSSARTVSSAPAVDPSAAGLAPPPRPRPAPRPLLLARITCPHCWHRFPPHDVLWVSRHAELLGDPLVGPDAQLCFSPSRFTADGAALDARGMVCHTLACPNCHLVLPRPLLEAEPLFASIVGVSASGKSYFLTAMTWELRRLLPRYFGVSFNDADTLFNRALNQGEETLFLAPDLERHVKLDKTDTVGSLMYDQIRMGQQAINLPRPFLFIMKPSGRHPNADVAPQLARVVCLYDNAGEHFSPGEDTASSPVTQHLGASRVLLFMYDPTQDPRFRARMRGLSHDPQLDGQSPTRRQETILEETAARVRRFAGLPATQQVDRAMLVIVPKADVWGPLCNLDLSTEPIVPNAVAHGTLAGVDLDRIEGVSAIVREMLMETAPEFVLAAEEFCSKVVYIPISALGSSPEVVDGREGLWIRPSRIRPRWVTAPFLYMFARWSHDVIGGIRYTTPTPLQ